MSELEREREKLMESEAPDLPFGARTPDSTRRNVGLWVAGILLALAVPFFYAAFGLAGAMVANGALPVVLVVTAFFIAVLGLGGVYAFSRIRFTEDHRKLLRDDFGNRLGGDTIDRIMKRDVVVCGTLDSIYDCAHEMYEHNVGFLIVLNEQDLCMGVITDRDLVCAGVAQDADLKSTPVTTIMETEMVSVGPGAALADCLALMQLAGVRRVPVVEGGRLVGVVTLDDLLAEERVTVEEVAPILRRQLLEPNPHHGLTPYAA